MAPPQQRSSVAKHLGPNGEERRPRAVFLRSTSSSTDGGKLCGLKLGAAEAYEVQHAEEDDYASYCSTNGPAENGFSSRRLGGRDFREGWDEEGHARRQDAYKSGEAQH